jgi:class 3 adenylate cyclase/tetratricopeptide (TPR) repeat protein
VDVAAAASSTVDGRGARWRLASSLEMGAHVSLFIAGARSETVTVIFTDVVGSTSWRVEVGGRTADELSVELERASRDVVTAAGGTVVKSLGDGVMATFTSALAALDAAAALQVLAKRLSIGGVEGCLRIGISSGDMVREGADWMGTAAIEASRLCSEAAGGSVLVADATVQLSRGHADHSLRPLGARLLRGFAAPIAVYELVTTRSASHALPPSISQAAKHVFVGRKVERGRADEMLDEVASGAARTMFVIGEPGIGKTRLAAAIAAQAHAEGFAVLHGRCDEGLAAPYQPIAEAFDPWLADCPDAALSRIMGPGGDELVQLWPSLESRLPTRAAAAAGIDPEARQWRLLEAVAGLVRSVADERPLLLVVDDLHWAAPSTRLALGHIARREVPRTALLATVRRPEAEQDPAALLGDLGVNRVIDVVKLGGLSHDEVADLVLLHAGDRPPVALCEELRRTTDGNPFFLTALLAHLDDVAQVRGDDGVWIEVDELTAAGVPESVRGVIARRRSALSGQARRALEVAAVVGLRFEERTIRRLTAAGPDESVAALDAAVAANLIRETGAGRFTFAHALVRHAMLDELTRTGLARLHWRVAQELEREVVDRPRASEIAYHYAEGREVGDPDTVARSSLAAADEAIDGAAFEEATSHLRTALSALDQMPPDPELRYRVLRTLGQALNALADDRAAERTWLDAADIARELGDPDRLFATVVGYGYMVRLHGDAELVRLLDDVLDLVGPGDSPLRAKALGWRAVPVIPSARGSRPDFDRVDEAVAMARRIGDRSALATTLRSRVLLRAYAPDAAAMLRDVQELVSLGPVGGEAITRDTAAVFRDQTTALLRLGRRAEAEVSVAIAAREAERNGLRMSQGGALFLQSALARASGRFGEAKRLAAEAGVRTEPHEVQPAYGAQVLATRMEEGRVREVIASLQALGSSGIVAPAWEAMLASALADDGQRRKAAEQLAALLDDQPSRFLEDNDAPLTIRHLTETCRQLDDLAHASAMLPHVEPWAGQLFVITFGLSIEGAADRAIGHLLATLGRLDEADHAYTSAADLERAAGFPPLLARTEYWHARALIDRNAQGDHERAVALLDDVIGITDQLGMRRLAEQARARRDEASS